MRYARTIIIIISAFAILSFVATKTEITAPQMSSVHPLKGYIPHGNRIFAGEAAFFRNKAGKALAPEQIFSMLSTESYIHALNDLQDNLIKENRMSADERISLDSHEHVVALLVTSLDYLKDNNIINPEDYAQFKDALPQYHLGLKRLEEQTAKPASEKSSFPTAYHSPTHTSLTPPILELARNVSLFNGLSMGFKMIFGIQGASAQGADCYRSGGIPLVPGPNLWAPCCDCDVDGYPVGCLNLMCAEWPAAIYDPETGVCGCG